MQRPKPNKLHDELDALLDGRPVELTDELAPLVEAADSLRAELASYELDPGVADRHLERVLEGSGTVVQLPVRQLAGGWDVRRRVVAVALAAALVLAPATIASAAALPGQAMYPFKLAIEQVRIASVQWSPAREADERTRVAGKRLDEVESLVSLRMFNQLPNALKALEQAVVAAQVAVAEAAEDGAPVATVASRLTQVRAAGGRVVEQVRVEAASGSIGLTGGTRDAVQAAVEDAQQDVLPPPVRETVPTGGTPTPTTADNPPNPPVNPTPAPTPPNTAATPPPTTAPPTHGPADHDAADQHAHHRAADQRDPGDGRGPAERRRADRGGRAGRGGRGPADDGDGSLAPRGAALSWGPLPAPIEGRPCWSRSPAVSVPPSSSVGCCACTTPATCWWSATPGTTCACTGWRSPPTWTRSPTPWPGWPTRSAAGAWPARAGTSARRWCAWASPAGSPSATATSPPTCSGPGCWARAPRCRRPRPSCAAAWACRCASCP